MVDGINILLIISIFPHPYEAEKYFATRKISASVIC